MIVKFHARGKAVEVARSITCWGGSVTAKATRSLGNPEEVRAN
ncbi:hypothetical protein ACLB1O_31235 [Escherichia coli]